MALEDVFSSQSSFYLNDPLSSFSQIRERYLILPFLFLAPYSLAEFSFFPNGAAKESPTSRM